MFGWIALIRYLMQIFIVPWITPRHYCNGSRHFAPRPKPYCPSSGFGKKTSAAAKSAPSLAFGTIRPRTKVP
jgi:hypothetical protein